MIKKSSISLITRAWKNDLIMGMVTWSEVPTVYKYQVLNELKKAVDNLEISSALYNEIVEDYNIEIENNKNKVKFLSFYNEEDNDLNDSGIIQAKNNKTLEF